MPRTSHEKELAEIKALTLELAESVRQVQQQLDRIVDAQGPAAVPERPKKAKRKAEQRASAPAPAAADADKGKKGKRGREKKQRSERNGGEAADRALSANGSDD